MAGYSCTTVEVLCGEIRDFEIFDTYLGHNKWICGSECVGYRSHTYILTY